MDIRLWRTARKWLRVLIICNRNREAATLHNGARRSVCCRTSQSDGMGLRYQSATCARQRRVVAVQTHAKRRAPGRLSHNVWKLHGVCELRRQFAHPRHGRPYRAGAVSATCHSRSAGSNVQRRRTNCKSSSAGCCCGSCYCGGCGSQSDYYCCGHSCV